MQQMEIPADVMGIRAAAKELGRAPSTISRQVAKGLIPNRGTAAEPKVSLAEARTARAENLAPPQAAPDSGFASVRTVHERIKAKRAALELAQIEGTLVSRSEMEEFVADKGGELRDGMLRRWRVFAADLVGLTAREIEEKCVAADEALLNAFVATL